MFEIETYVVEVAVLMNDWTLVDGDVLLMFELQIGLAVAVLIIFILAESVLSKRKHI